MTRSARAATVAAAVVVLLVALSPGALAGWTARTDPAALPVSTATLAPPTGLAAANGCLLTVPSVPLSWTATTSSFATGYRVLRRTSTEATFTQLASVTGRSTTSYTDSTVVGGTTYVYAVQAVYAGWTAPSGEVSISVPLVCP